MKRLVFVGLSLLLILVSRLSQAAPLPPLREVNAPYFSDGLHFDETAVFWFGRVTLNENYADVRVGYIDRALWVDVNVIDRRLWYDTTPSPNTLTNWDSVTLYLDKRGNTGSTPTTETYRFDAQLNWAEPRDHWQAGYRGNGSGWVSIPITFTTYGTWYNPNGVPNTATDAHGWFMAYSIPFQNLGLSGPPARGTTWGLGIVLHDRDTATGSLESDKSWPENMLPDQPSSWGRLRFGLPGYTLSTPVVARGTVVVRQGLNGAVVPDAVVGGNTLCGGTLSDYFVQWGNLNYAHVPVYNVQNVEHISEWPCFSKVFITFPLTSLPIGNEIISATLTLYHRGNPGPPPGPAYIQVLSVDQSWDENTITWNNAPLTRENLGGIWIPPVWNTTVPYPGIPYNWDVSRALAEAYAAGEPLRLAVYSSNSPFSNGRYFASSEFDDTGAIARPTLQVSWGERTPAFVKTASVPVVLVNQPVTYTFSLISTGSTMTVTDDLPVEVSPPGALQATSGFTAYSSALHRVTWTGASASGQKITVTFPVTVVTALPSTIVNRAMLTDGATTISATALMIANGHKVWLPLISTH